MDVYPEIAVELGEIGRSSLVGKIAGCMIRRAYRRCAGVVALDEDMASRLRRHGISPSIIRPWVFKSILSQPPPQVAPEDVMELGAGYQRVVDSGRAAMRATLARL